MDATSDGAFLVLAAEGNRDSPRPSGHQPLNRKGAKANARYGHAGISTQHGRAEPSPTAAGWRTCSKTYLASNEVIPCYLSPLTREPATGVPICWFTR
jgi:hypothetical protein